MHDGCVGSQACSGSGDAHGHNGHTCAAYVARDTGITSTRLVPQTLDPRDYHMTLCADVGIGPTVFPQTIAPTLRGRSAARCLIWKCLAIKHLKKIKEIRPT